MELGDQMEYVKEMFDYERGIHVTTRAADKQE